MRQKQKRLKYGKWSKTHFFEGVVNIFWKRTNGTILSIAKMYYSSKSYNKKWAKYRGDWNMKNGKKHVFFKRGAKISKNPSKRSWGTLLGRFMPNFDKLAQIKEVENSGELNREENDKKRVFLEGGKISGNPSKRSWGTLLGRFLPNFVELAQLEVVENSGELNLVTRKKERRRHSWLENGHFQTVIKSELFRNSTCGQRHRIKIGPKNPNQ